MPKRRNEEKIAYYEEKIKRIQHKLQKKQRRAPISSDCSESENIEDPCLIETNIYMDNEDFGQPNELPEIETCEVHAASPQLPLSSPPILVPEPKEAQIAPTPPAEDALEPPLDPELLAALGACTPDNPEFGDSIHDNLSNIWTPILRKGLPKEEKDKLTREYQVPNNCKLLQTPKLNAEISAAVSDIARGRDKKMSNFQQDLGVGLSAINRGMDLLLKTDNKVLALKNLSDGCRLLSGLHYCLTKDRIKLITPSLEKSILHVIQDTERDETLFGNSLAEKIKASKAVERQGNLIRNKVNLQKINPPHTSGSRPVHQGNWSGPPRFTPNRGGRGGRGRAVSSAPRRHYTTTTTQSTSRGPLQPKSRANTQQ